MAVHRGEVLDLKPPAESLTGKVVAPHQEVRRDLAVVHRHGACRVVEHLHGQARVELVDEHRVGNKILRGVGRQPGAATAVRLSIPTRTVAVLLMVEREE